MSEERAEYVTTPLGRGRVVSRAMPEGYLICLSRKDYTPEQWATISNGGPCIFKVFKPEEITAESE
jgi:hypothetical protein